MSTLMQISNYSNPIRPENVFKTADSNSDSKVSKTELAQVMGDTQATNVFGKVDADGDGNISQSEDSAWLKKMKDRFQSVASGEDVSTSITSLMEELLKKLQENQNSSSDSSNARVRPEDVFKTADTNGDDQVSQSELAGVIGSENGKQIFRQIDSDGDGSISKTEDDTWQTQMKSEGFGGVHGPKGPPPPPAGSDESSTTDSDSSSTSSFSEMVKELIAALQTQMETRYTQTGQLRSSSQATSLFNVQA